MDFNPFRTPQPVCCSPSSDESIPAQQKPPQASPSSPRDPQNGAKPPQKPTSLAGVVHQDDLGEEAARGAVDDAVDGAEQRAPGLVVEHDHHARVGQLVGVHFGLAPATK